MTIVMIATTRIHPINSMVAIVIEKQRRQELSRLDSPPLMNQRVAASTPLRLNPTAHCFALVERLVAQGDPVALLLV